ncbi:TetR/AcrR family transcriptional regulator [Zestomonas carbonaria]|uniref:TetR/AcrR family transcriptional regulator n=1 Tax=Zestomonas carbonaria TaxID=2762745 RepID=UPI0016570352|nr:TetR/AcrR family transcriptional regulator [Pseudomonas carbonaria]
MKIQKASSRIYGGISQEERVAARRKKFLRAGLEIFGGVGFRAATVRGICRQAGLTDRYFYESFGSIENLLLGVYKECTDELTKRVMENLRSVKPGSDLRDYIHDGLSTFFSYAQDPLVARVCWLEVLGVSEEINKAYTKVILDFSILLATVLKMAHPRWRLDEEELNASCLAIVGAASESVKYWYLSGYKAKRSVMISGVARVFAGTLRAYEEVAGKN